MTNLKVGFLCVLHVQGCHSLLHVWLKRMSSTGDSCICQKENRGRTVSSNEGVKGG